MGDDGSIFDAITPSVFSLCTNSDHELKALLLILPMLLPVTMISFTVAEETTELPLQIVKPAAASVPVPGYRVFDQSYFSGSYTTLAYFMQSVNGIQVNQSGAIEDPVLVSVQGASSGQTKLYIDGVLANTGQFGNYDLNSIPIEQIKRVDSIHRLGRPGAR